MMKYLNCKVFYITFTLNNILDEVFPDLLEQLVLLCTEIMTCLIFKCLLLAVVGLESILISLAFLFVFMCVGGDTDAGKKAANVADIKG